MDAGLRQREALRPPVAGRARAWLRAAVADSSVRTAGALWLASKVAILTLAWIASWALQPNVNRPAPLGAAWEHWDAVQFRVIAQYGYFGPPGKSMANQAAFLPGYPLLLRAVHLLAGSWTAAELTIAAVAGFFAILGLIRLAEDYRAGSGPAAAVLLLAAPAAVFLSVGYSEPLFLAFALPSWLAARRGAWASASLLAAAACTVRVSGLFLLAGLMIMAVQQWIRQRQGSTARAGTGRKAAVAALLAVPLLPLIAYETFLHHATGDWLAWQRAERVGWGRYFGNPVTTLTTTWQAAFGHEFHAPLALMFQLELGAVLVLFVVILAALWQRQWPEAAYSILTAAALIAGTWYESVPRALLLVWPLWCGLARIAQRHRWLAGIWLACSVPLMVITALLYLSGSWAG